MNGSSTSKVQQLIAHNILLDSCMKRMRCWHKVTVVDLFLTDYRKRTVPLDMACRVMDEQTSNVEVSAEGQGTDYLGIAHGGVHRVSFLQDRTLSGRTTNCAPSLERAFGYGVLPIESHATVAKRALAVR